MLLCYRSTQFPGSIRISKIDSSSSVDGGHSTSIDSKQIGFTITTKSIPFIECANDVRCSWRMFYFQVSTEEGKNLASQLGCPFYETSAALRHYIDDAFYTLIREIRRKEAQRVSLSSIFLLRYSSLSWAILTGLSKFEKFYSIYFNSLQALSNGSSSEKLHSRRRSRWWRIRSIFALVFKRRRHSN